MEDVAIVLKTGSTEVCEKLPIHLLTTLAYVKDYVVYSNIEQKVGSVLVHDALALLAESSRSQHDHHHQYSAL